MRIFYAAVPTPNVALQSDLWRRNLYEPLVDLGHDVIEFAYDLRTMFADAMNGGSPAIMARHRERASEELFRQIRLAHSAKPIDLFFSYYWDFCIFPETIDAIRALGIRTVNWYCNGSFQLNLVREISPHYDWCLVPEKFRLDDYRAMGARPIYCQEAANPNVYTLHDVPVEFDVTFVGAAYGERPAYIRHLLDSGIDVRVWGPGWQRATTAGRTRHIANRLLTADGWKSIGRWTRRARNRPDSMTTLPERVVGPPLSDAELVRMYSRSKINLGFSTCGETHYDEKRVLQIRLRDFEVPMGGGFYMVEYMEELEEFFEIGKEIVCYQGRDDLVEKIRYYLRHDTERERIRQAGHQRCRREHTWQARLQSSFERMGLTR